MPTVNMTEKDLQWPNPQMAAAIREFGFEAAWKDEIESTHPVDYDRFYQLCNKVRAQCEVPAYTRAKFDEGWQYRTVLKEDYEDAFEEFYNLCFGWW